MKQGRLEGEAWWRELTGCRLSEWRWLRGESAQWQLERSLPRGIGVPESLEQPRRRVPALLHPAPRRPLQSFAVSAPQSRLLCSWKQLGPFVLVGFSCMLTCFGEACDSVFQAFCCSLFKLQPLTRSLLLSLLSPSLCPHCPPTLLFQAAITCKSIFSEDRNEPQPQAQESPRVKGMLPDRCGQVGGSAQSGTRGCRPAQAEGGF